MQFNQYITPEKNDSIMTAKFMLGILTGKYWMLKSDDVKTLKTVAFPPSKKVLAKIVYDAMIAFPSVSPEIDHAIRQTAVLVLKKPSSIK